MDTTVTKCPDLAVPSLTSGAFDDKGRIRLYCQVLRRRLIRPDTFTTLDRTLRVQGHQVVRFQALRRRTLGPEPPPPYLRLGFLFLMEGG